MTRIEDMERLFERKLVHSVQLWEQITGKKAPYSVRHVDSSHRMSEKEIKWLQQMEQTIEEWSPEAHGYRRYRAKCIGYFFEKKLNPPISCTHNTEKQDEASNQTKKGVKNDE